MRFHDLLLSRIKAAQAGGTQLTMPPHVRVWMGRHGKDWLAAYMLYQNLLDDDNTQRIIFDARQVMLFDAIGESPEKDMLSKLRLPFPNFYLEFTEPIRLGEQEPGQDDWCRALMFSSTTRIEGINVIRPKDCIGITGFYTSQNGDLVDRTIWYSLARGTAVVRANVALSEPDPSTLPVQITPDDYPVSFVEHGVQPEDLVYYDAGSYPEDRHIGWWERNSIQLAQVSSWILAYLMAKGIRIEREPLSRQQRREAERKELKPWHVVRLEPKFTEATAERPAGEPEHHHSYRYDVIGHLRLGRHKTKSGYVEHIEWVAPHQRGLANEVYLPKTYMVKGGRRISPRVQGYFGKGIKT